MQYTQLHFRSKQTNSNQGSPMHSVLRKDNLFQNFSQIANSNPRALTKFIPTPTRANSKDLNQLPKTNGFVKNFQIPQRVGVKFPTLNSGNEKNDLGRATQIRFLNKSNNNEDLTVDSLTESVLQNHKTYRASHEPAKGVSDYVDSMKHTAKIPTHSSSKKDLGSLLSVSVKLASSEKEEFSSRTALADEKFGITDKTLTSIESKQDLDLNAIDAKSSQRTPKRVLTPIRRKHTEAGTITQEDLHASENSARPLSATRRSIQATLNDNPVVNIQDLKKPIPPGSNHQMPFNQAIRLKADIRTTPKAPCVDMAAENSKNNTIFAMSSSNFTRNFARKNAISHRTAAPGNADMMRRTGMKQIFERSRHSADRIDESQKQAMQTFYRKVFKPHISYGIRTLAGSTAHGQAKINQDNFIAVEQIGDYEDRYLFGVYDGHGANGHLVTEFIKKTLPGLLAADPNFSTNPRKSFTTAYELCDRRLQISDVDSNYSGSTAVSVLISGNRLTVANAGDSRAVLGKLKKGLWTYAPLTIDHKLSNIAEIQRIIKMGGRVEPYRDSEGKFVGPNRVWIKNMNGPGLAMARSIGDLIVSTIGVICHPEMKEMELTPDDKFIIIASDGIWEFMHNSEVVKLIAPYYEQKDVEGACEAVLKAAIKVWQLKQPDAIDDITLIIIFL